MKTQETTMSCQSFIEKINREAPELLCPKDLVKWGIFKTPQAAYIARKKNMGPPYFRLPQNGVLYPRNGVVDYLTKHRHDAS